MDFAILAIATRGLTATALISLFGALFFNALVAPASMRPRLIALARISAGIALAAGGTWLTAETVAIAGTAGLDALTDVAFHSRFGQAMGLCLALVAVALASCAAPRSGRHLALVAAAAALGLQGIPGHAGAAEGVEAAGLPACAVLHVLAAGVWLGGLLPLLVCLSALPPAEAKRVFQRFSPFALTAAISVAATAFALGWGSIGSFPALLGTDYGWAALFKLALLLAMLFLAVWRRRSVVGWLDDADSASIRRWLFLAGGAEAACGLLIVLTAGLLASLPPGIQAESTWPFAWRPSLDAMQDPDLRWEVAVALCMIGAALGCIALSWFAGRWRVLTLLATVPLIGWEVPSLDLLLVDAYPTSYRISPTGFTAASIADGQTVFAAHCAACHGSDGQGNGPVAAGLRIKPASLVAEHLWDHPEGELFWWLSQGIDDPEGGLAMPGFAASLSADERWDAIDFIRALNAGATLWRTDTWTHPVPAPDMAVVCDDSAAVSLSDLRGRFVRIAAILDSETPLSRPPDGIVLLRLDIAPGHRPPPWGCASATGAAWPAYALVSGVSEADLTGMNWLVDKAGWLRAVHRPNEAADWNDPTVLAAVLRNLRELLNTGSLGGIHVHRH